MLQGINLDSADLSKLDLRFINFKMANLRKTDLAHANLSNCCLERANLSGAHMDVSSLKSDYDLTFLLQCDLYSKKNCMENRYSVTPHSEIPICTILLIQFYPVCTAI